MSSESFIAGVKRHGLSKTNRFRVEIPLPQLVQDRLTGVSGQPADGLLARATTILKSAVLGRSSDYQRGLELMCDIAELPGMDFLTTESRRNTSNRKIPYDIQHADAVFEFYVSSDLLEKKIIEAWISSIYDKKYHSFSYYDDYITDIVVHQKDESGNEQHSIRLTEAYPIQVASMALNAGDANVHKLSVTFTYYQWVVVGSDEEGGGFFSDIKNPGDLFEKATNPQFLNKVYDVAMGNNPGFTGEALFVYNKISDLTNKYANVSVNELSNIVSTIKNDLGSNNNITNQDKLSLSNIIDGVKSKLQK